MAEWIAIAASFIAILSTGAAVVSKIAKMEQRMETNEARDKEEREDNKKKFEELYNRSNSTKESIVELTTTIKMMVTQNEKNFADIKIKLDEVIKKSEGKQNGTENY